jgi:AhpD family alkylhydroperoxidase
MAHVPLPPDIPGMRSLLAFRPETTAPITALAQILLHAPNSLTCGERELIPARVSALNDCTFCRSSHAAIAACHLGDEVIVAAGCAIRTRRTLPRK